MRNLTDDEDKREGNIRIESQQHFDILIKEGFEVDKVRFQYDSSKNQTSVTLILKKGNVKLVADANAIDEYAIQLQYQIHKWMAFWTNL